MNAVIDILRKHPELAVFFCLAVGYWLGSLKFGRFKLGTVVGTLLVALIVGQAHVNVPDFIKTLFFAFFMFATGYHVGPQFFSGLRKGGLQLAALSVLFCFTGLALVLLMSQLFGFDKGFAAGLLSGALTQSSAIGSSTDAINQLALPQEARQMLAHHVPIGDAVTYVFGTIGPAILLSKIAPRLIRADLKAECEKMEDEMAGGKSGRTFGSYVAIDLQAFQLSRPEADGQTAGELEKRLPERCYIQQVRRERRLIKPEEDFVLRIGDVLVISGDRERLIKVETVVGEQVVDPEAMDVPFEIVPVIVTEKRVIGKTIGELGEQAPSRAKGLHLRRILRQGQVLPRLPNTRVARGDILELAGRPEDIARAAKFVGFALVPSEKTDLIFMCTACVLGVLVGAISVNVGVISVSLGASGGILILGLIFGWLHSVYPRFGRIPPPAVWLMETLGLNVFIIGVGLAAGPHAIEAMKSSGVQLLLAGIVVTLVPHVVTLLAGRFVFKMNAGILLGACAGAGTATPAIQAVRDESESSIPTLGFTVPYALSSVILTAWGPVVVALVPQR